MFIPDASFDNSSALVHMMDGRQAGDKPLAEPMMDLLTGCYMCVIRPHAIIWVNSVTVSKSDLWPLLLTWFNFNPSMDL